MHTERCMYTGEWISFNASHAAVHATCVKRQAKTGKQYPSTRLLTHKQTQKRTYLDTHTQRQGVKHTINTTQIHSHDIKHTNCKTPRMHTPTSACTADAHNTHPHYTQCIQTTTAIFGPASRPACTCCPQRPPHHPTPPLMATDSGRWTP